MGLFSDPDPSVPTPPGASPAPARDPFAVGQPHRHPDAEGADAPAAPQGVNPAA